MPRRSGHSKKGRSLANIALASVTGDVIQVRARPEGTAISYRIVDEYEAEGSCYKCKPERSAQPLTLGNLIDLIDSAHGHDDYWGVGLVEPPLAASLDGHGDVDALRSFIKVTSPFYQQLSSYYEARVSVWLDDRATGDE